MFRRRATILGLVLSLACARPACAQQAPAQAAPQPYQLLQEESLDILTQPNGLIAIRGEINGQSGNFLVDTGNIAGVLSESAANQLKIPSMRGNGALRMLGGISLNRYALADSFRLGHLTGSKVMFVLSPSNVLPPDTIGMIGPSILANYDVEVDFVKGKFNLFKPGECSSRAVYWTRDAVAAVPISLDEARHIVVPVEINGKRINAIIDTGAERSVTNLDVAQSVLGIDAKDPALKSLGDVMINGRPGTAGYRYPFPPLSFEGIAVQHPDILIIGTSKMGSHAPEMILGMNILRRLHLYIAYQKRILLLSDAEAH